ncbi:hypothetical protein LCGC14_2536200, partial [marine sediment metagenome]
MIGGTDAQQALDSQDVVQATQVVAQRPLRGSDVARQVDALATPSSVPLQRHSPTPAAEDSEARVDGDGLRPVGTATPRVTRVEVDEAFAKVEGQRAASSTVICAYSW